MRSLHPRPLDQLADRAEGVAEALVEFSVDTVAAGVEGLGPGLGAGGLDGPGGGVAGLGDGGDPPGADLGQERDAERGAFGRVHGADVVAINVGLDLPPEGVAGAPAAEA